MSLGKRVSLIILITLTMLLSTLSVFVDRVIVDEFRQHETTAVHQHIQRIKHAFENLEAQLSAKVVDWAQWDDTYQFMKREDQKYIDETVNFLTLSALQFQQVVYFDTNAKPLHHYEVFTREERVGDVPAATLQLLSSAPLAREAKDAPITGLLKLDQSLVLFASSPILDTNREKEPRGSLLGTMLVNPPMFGTLAAQTNLSLTAVRLGIDQLGKSEEGALQHLMDGEDAFIQEVDDKLLHGYGLIRDIQGQPALLFRVDNPRSSFQQALQVQSFMRASLIVAAMLWAALTLWLLNFFILKPVKRLSTEVRGIAQAGNSALRVGDWEGGQSLKLRALLIIGVTMLVLTGALSFFFSHVLNEEFARIERNDLVDDVHRAQRALDERKENLLSKSIDWAQWDDTYQFVLDQNKEYPEANITFDTLSAIGMSHVLFFDTTAKLVTGWALDLSSQNIKQVLPSETKTTAPFDAFVQGKTEPNNGYVALDSRILMVAMSPILDTTRTKPSRGSFLFAMPIDSTLAEVLSSQTELNLKFNDKKIKKKENEIVTTEDGISIFTEGESTIVGRVPLRDFQGRELIAMEVSSARQVFQQGLNAQHALVIWLLAASIIFIAVTLFAIQRWVIKRVSDLKREFLSGVFSLDKIGNASKRDELSVLSKDINGMLSALNNAQTEIMKARDSAETANAAKSMFIARVSHELRTPVAGIIGINHMILKRESSKAIRELVKMSDQVADGLLSVINEILDFSKAEVGELTFEKIPFDLREVVRLTMRVIAARLEGRYKPGEQERLELVCDVDPSVPNALIGDPTKLKQILINLLGNAVKFTQSGYVGLRVEMAEPGKVRFKVWDTGIGIPADKLGLIFTPFKQADESVTRRYQGTGLGLSIVKQFTEALGGEVTVSSTPGKGSEFVVHMPLTENNLAQPGVNTNLRSAQAQAGWPSNACLLAEKDPVSDALIQNFLGYGVAVKRYDPANISEPESIKLNETALLILSEESLSTPHVRKLMESRLRDKRGCTAAMVRPSSIALHEELHALGMEHILPIPVLADDLIFVCLGQRKTEGQQVNTQQPVRAAGAKLRILIADDTSTNRMILEDMLAEAGHDVTSVIDGTEVIERLTPMITGVPNAEHFDIVLTDVSMTLMDGDAAAREIRKLESQQGRSIHVPIIAVTAHAMAEEQQKIKAAGIDGVLTKPLRPAEVAAELHRCAGRSK